jgi:hypothetical protein
MNILRCFSVKAVGASLCLILVGCNSKSSQGGSAPQKSPSSDGTAQSTVGSAPPKKDGVFDYPKRHCSQVRKIKVKPEARIEDELSYFCNGEEPTKEMLDLRSSLLNDPDKLIINKIFVSHIAQEETSEFKLVWGYNAAHIRPYVVQTAPLYSFITKDLADDFVNIKTKSERLPDKAIDYGLHLWSANMAYDLIINASDGVTLTTKRKTQYNLYQVESGNEEMGFGVEHLTDGNNGDFSISNMINLSMNDGKGFNDGSGGTVVLTMLHLKMNNRGFPETTEKVVEKLGFFFAKSMFDGLKSYRK